MIMRWIFAQIPRSSQPVGWLEVVNGGGQSRRARAAEEEGELFQPLVSTVSLAVNSQLSDSGNERSWMNPIHNERLMSHVSVC